MSRVEERLAALGLELPQPPVPVANFLPYRVHEGLVFLAGQVCEWNGATLFVGKLGREFALQQGQNAARVCALNLLACLKLACNGDLDRVRRCLRVGGFVNSDPEYEHVPLVVNGASDLFAELFGDHGRHARTAIGVSTLPRRAAVEVDAIFSIDPSA